MAGAAAAPAGWRSGVRVTQARVLLSEWTKLRSLRSSRWSLVAAVVLTVGLPCLFAAVVSSHWGHMSLRERSHRHPLDIALAGVNLSQLAIGVLGVLVITGEYSTGMIRATLGAVPKRLPMLWGKVGVFALVSFVLALPSVIVAFYGTMVITLALFILLVGTAHALGPGVTRALQAVSVVLLAVLGAWLVMAGVVHLAAPGSHPTTQTFWSRGGW